MSQTPESITPAGPSVAEPAVQQRQRPFRVKLRGSVLMLIRLPNRRELRGKLHQLSTTGGLMHLEKPLDEKLRVEVIFQLGDATVHEKAEMLFPMWATQGWLQPFRFLDLPEASKNALEASLQSFVRQLQEPAR
jgi:c-di-GMP-binding flagellar brake protein YcgR